MSKELESWNEIRSYLNYVLYGSLETKALTYTSTSDYLQPFIDVVENALKDYNNLKKEYKELDEEYKDFADHIVEQYNFLCAESLANMKKIKALEIIKNKPQIEITHIQWGKIKTYDEYLKIVYEWDSGYEDMILTQEEFDLLKKVLK